MIIQVTTKRQKIRRKILRKSRLIHLFDECIVNLNLVIVPCAIFRIDAFEMMQIKEIFQI